MAMYGNFISYSWFLLLVWPTEILWFKFQLITPIRSMVFKQYTECGFFCTPCYSGILVITVMNMRDWFGNKWRGVTISLLTGGQGHPTPSFTPTPPPNTHNNHCSIINARFLRFQLERDRPTDQRMDKGSYRGASPQLNVTIKPGYSIKPKILKKLIKILDH